MKSLKTSLKMPSIKAPNRFIWGFLIISLAGFADATYLTLKHYLATPLICTVFEGCEKVTTSQYATIGGIPVALFGVIYYLTIFFLVLAYLETKQIKVINFAARLTIVGFLASIYFLYLQIFVIHAFCLYCLISFATSTFLFILGLIVIKLFKSRDGLGR